MANKPFEEGIGGIPLDNRMYEAIDCVVNSRNCQFDGRGRGMAGQEGSTSSWHPLMTPLLSICVANHWGFLLLLWLSRQERRETHWATFP